MANIVFLCIGYLANVASHGVRIVAVISVGKIMLFGGRFSAAICALLHMMHPVIGRFPSAALMCAWAGGGDGFGLRFIVADGAYLMPGTGFSGSCFFIDDPVAIGVGGFRDVCVAS